MKGLNIIILSCIFANLAGCVASNPVKESKTEKILYYMHGSRLETLPDTHKRYRNYRTIVRSLENSGFTVITEHRGETSVGGYASALAKEINQKIADGVNPRDITVAGFSKGAVIALLTAGIVRNPNVNYVALAGCTNFFSVPYERIQGRILSIYDIDDHKFFSCQEHISSDMPGVTFREVELNSGKGHKVFRKKKEKWVYLWRDPMIEWVTMK